MDNWFYYCCYAPFILAPLGLAKGIIFGLPSCVACTICSTIIILLFLPYDVVLAFRIVYTTAYLGPNVRCFLIFFFPVLAIACPVLAITVLFLVFLFFNVFGIAATVFDESCDDERSTISFYKDSWKIVKEVYKYVKNEAPNIASDVSSIPHQWDGQVYDIPFIKLLVGIVLLVYGTIVGLVMIPIISIIKFPFCIYRVNKSYVEFCMEREFYWFLLELLGFVCINGLLLPLALLVGAPLYGFIVGIRCSAEALRTDSMKEGYRESVRIVREFDTWTTTDMIFDGDRNEDEVYSCIPRVADRLDVEIVSPPGPNNNEPDPMEDLFHKFELLGLKVTKDALRNGWTKQQDVVDLEPFLMIGIPGLAAFDVLLRSARQSHGKDEIVCGKDSEYYYYYGSASSTNESRTITFDNKPNHGIAFVFWPKLMRTKRVIERVDAEFELAKEEIEWIRCKLLTNGARHVTSTANDILNGLEEERRNELTRSIVSTLNSLAIDTSRLLRTGRMITFISENALKTDLSDNEEGDKTAVPMPVAEETTE